MSALVTRSTARKRHPCSWDCGSLIESGQPHVRWALPPGDEWNTGESWQSGTAHGEDPTQCPTFIHGDPHPAMDEIWDAAWRRDAQKRPTRHKDVTP
jgi:hypothetical protein